MPGEPAYNNLISRIRIGDTSDAENSIRASAIPYGQVDSTSTATAFTATVPGINVLRDGVCVLLKNGVVTSASGFTINVNGLGAKPSYTNLAAATRDTTIFNIGYTMLFIYDEDRVSGGCWICYRGYDANTNTIGYQLRTNSSTLPAADKGYKYRLWFTSADGAKWVPANTSTSTDATTSRTPNTTPINPFGPIVYNSTNGTVNANASLPAATLWQQYTLTIGYSFNEPGGAMAYPAPVYLKCTPQTNGSAVMSELVQALPSTDDGFIYILLGRAYSATAIELTIEHPVFYNDGTGIRAWTGKRPFSGSYTDLTNKPSIPTKTSDLTNDSNFITAAQAPVQSVNGQTGAVTTAEKFVITATAISGTDYYNLDKTYADINVAIGHNKYVTIEDIDATYPYTTTVSQGVVFGATLIATGEGNQLMAVTDGILVVQPDSGTNAMGIAVHSTNVLPTMSDIPSASNTTPLMDGTADVGIQTYIYARADHVHPTDTSRQAVLVSGTNIKTINNESILGSGNISISAGSSDVFVVEYGTTTYAEISAALNEDKLLFCHVSWNNIVCPYIGVVNSQYAFSNLGAGESTVSLYVNSSDTWSYATSNLATKITASGILKGDGLGTVTAAIAGTDYGAVIRRWTDVS